MNREKNKSKLLTRRALLIAGGQGALFAAIAARLYDLQVLQSDRYTMLADENRINIRLIAPQRGRILDRFGVHLADNRLTYSVVLVPEQTGDIQSTLDAVALLIPLTDADRHRVIRDVRRKHSFVPIALRENVSWEEMARIEVNTLELPGVSIEQGTMRNYPFGPTNSHIVGYVAAVSEKELTGDPVLELPDFRIGKNGIEREYDLELRGSAGTRQIEVNALGRVARELAREDGVPGEDAVLSIDMALQDFLTRRCATETSVACAVMDAWTGEVLALVSSPGYDPTAFINGLSQQEWLALQADEARPLNNKVTGGTYAPGSTFKPMVALAALEAGVMTPETHVNCPGYFQLGDAEFHCWKHGGHGVMIMREAIKHSCDVFFFETARRLGIDRIAAMAQRFGLGSPTGIDLPGEAPGLMPTTDWKLATTGVKWQQGETISCGIGQSYVTVTPLQLCVMAARLVTNRAIVPRLFRDDGVMKAEMTAAEIPGDDFDPIGIPAANLDLVLDGMMAVVNEQGGTAYTARIAEPGLAMGGKSGTSQVRHISAAEREHGVRKNIDLPWKERDHALFISFAPVGAPRYVCATVVEHGGETGGGGSAVAAPICRDVLREVQQRDPARRLPEKPFGATLVSQKD
jgi:penicillin-binding protein 2